MSVAGATGVGLARDEDDELEHSFAQTFNQSGSAVVHPADTSLDLAAREKEIRDLRRDARGVPTAAQAEQLDQKLRQYGTTVEARERATLSTIESRNPPTNSGPGGSSVPGTGIIPKHARGYGGEQGAAFEQYSTDKGWAIIRGPSGAGAGGHGVTTSGEDILAYNVRTKELHIVDNKSVARRRNIGGASAIERDENLEDNLGKMIAFVEGQNTDRLPMRQEVLSRLRKTRAAVRSGASLPARVSLVVTHVGGSSTGITQGLRDQGITSLPKNESNDRSGAARPQLGRGPQSALPAKPPPPGSANPPLTIASLPSLSPALAVPSPATQKPVSKPATPPVPVSHGETLEHSPDVKPTAGKPVPPAKALKAPKTDTPIPPTEPGPAQVATPLSARPISTSLTRAGGLTGGQGMAGLHGSAGAERSQDLGKGISAQQSIAFGGKVVSQMQEILGSHPRQYQVTLTINREGHAGLGASAEKGGGEAGVSLSASGALTMSFSHRFSAEEARKYTTAAGQGSGGSFPELEVARLLKAGTIDGARKLLGELKSSSRSKALAEG